MDTLTVQVLGAYAEIDQVNVRAALIPKILALQEYIVWLKITVDEAQLVNGLESFQQADPNLYHVLETKSLGRG